MSLETIRDQLPDYARDLKLNLGSVLTPQGAPGLSERQIASIALVDGDCRAQSAARRVRSRPGRSRSSMTRTSTLRARPRRSWA